MDMNCPNCGEPMMRGEATLDRTAHNFLAFGFGSSNLYFRYETGGKDVMLTPWRASGAFRCPECSLMVLDTEG